MLLSTATSVVHTSLLTFVQLAVVHRWPLLQQVQTEVTHHQDPRHQTVEGENITLPSILNMELIVQQISQWCFILGDRT